MTLRGSFLVALVTVLAGSSVPGCTSSPSASTPVHWSELPVQVDGLLHRVAPGETFYSIARAHGIAVDALLALNPGHDPRDLAVGTLLRVPKPVIRAVSPRPAAASARERQP